MVVPDEAGRCECPQCGATCGGQFKACTAIIATPGYVPITAPKWALVRQHEAIDAVTGADGTPQDGPGSDGRAEATEGAPTAPEVPHAVAADLTGLIEDLGKQLATRDDELAALFERVLEAFGELRDTLADQAASIAALDGTVAQIKTVIEAVPAPLFGFRRK